MSGGSGAAEESVGASQPRNDGIIRGMADHSIHISEAEAASGLRRSAGARARRSRGRDRAATSCPVAGRSSRRATMCGWLSESLRLAKEQCVYRTTLDADFVRRSESRDRQSS